MELREITLIIRIILNFQSKFDVICVTGFCKYSYSGPLLAICEENFRLTNKFDWEDCSNTLKEIYSIYFQSAFVLNFQSEKLLKMNQSLEVSSGTLIAAQVKNKLQSLFFETTTGKKGVCRLSPFKF